MTEPRIVRNPDIIGGKPIIEGTRLSVELILGWLVAGSSREELLASYPNLTNEQISACIEYALKHIPSILVPEAAE